MAATGTSKKRLSYPHLKTLDPSLLPTIPDPLFDHDEHRRLIIIGDVHGHSAALKALLVKARYAPYRDHVVFVGDMVNKGPDSSGVVSFAMGIGASAVRGNHEERVLGAWAAHDTKGKGKEKQKGKEITAKESSDLATARSLTSEERAWLGELPLILKLGNLGPRYGDVVVVHAGLVPEVPLLSQDPEAVMTMRTLIAPDHHHHGKRSPKSKSFSETDMQTKLDELVLTTTPPDEDSNSKSIEEIHNISDSNKNHDNYLIPSPSREGQPWAKSWTKAQKALVKNQKDSENGHQKDGDEHKKNKEKNKNKNKDKKTQTPMTVVYGHDAKAGLQMRKYAFGIDSGCGNDRELTALIFEVPRGDGAVATNAASKGGNREEDEDEDELEEGDEADNDDDDDDDNDDKVKDSDGEEEETQNVTKQKRKKEQKHRKGTRIRHRLVSVSCADVE